MINAWPGTMHAVVPNGCLPCSLCEVYCMGAETVEPDWHGRGKVIRIFSLCDKSMEYDNDSVRTGFHATEEDAVEEWNEMVARGLPC